MIYAEINEINLVKCWDPYLAQNKHKITSAIAFILVNQDQTSETFIGLNNNYWLRVQLVTAKYQ